MTEKQVEFPETVTVRVRAGWREKVTRAAQGAEMAEPEWLRHALRQALTAAKHHGPMTTAKVRLSDDWTPTIRERAKSYASVEAWIRTLVHQAVLDRSEIARGSRVFRRRLMLGDRLAAVLQVGGAAVLGPSRVQDLARPVYEDQAGPCPCDDEEGRMHAVHVPGERPSQLMCVKCDRIEPIPEPEEEEPGPRPLPAPGPPRSSTLGDDAQPVDDPTPDLDDDPAPEPDDDPAAAEQAAAQRLRELMGDPDDES